MESGVTAALSLHALARCPYHPDGGALEIDCPAADLDHGVLRCSTCRREFAIEEGVYRLMPDDLRPELQVGQTDAGAIRQMASEMRQRDERATASSPFHREPPGSPLYWMNIQYDAVTRLASLGRGGVAVDFGTGVGRYVPWLLERFEKVVATDFSFASLRTLRSYLTPAHRERCLLVQCDLSRLSLSPGIAEGGLCVEVLQHLPDVDLRCSAIANIARTMVAGAGVCLVTNAYAIARRVAGSPQARQDGTIFSYWHTYAEMRALVEPCFELEQTHGIISFDTFPIRKLSAAWRIRADAWLERTPFGRLVGRDMLLNLRRKAA